MDSYCPVESAHRKLISIHIGWHDLTSHVDEPTRFRRDLNMLLSEMREISLMVQKQKSHLEFFDTWYAEWMEEMTECKVAKWIVKSRNRIVHEADLDLFSSCLVESRETWTQGKRFELKVSPFSSTEEIVERLFREINNPPRLIAITRIWRDYQRSSSNILEDVAHAIEHYRKLIYFAHGHRVVSDCFRNEGAMLECGILENPADKLLCLVDPLSSVTTQVQLDTEAGASSGVMLLEGVRHNFSQVNTSMWDTLSPATYASDFVEPAKDLLRQTGKRGNFPPAVIYVLQNGSIEVEFIPTFQPSDKWLKMQRVTHHSNRLNAVGVVLANDTWYSELDRDEMRNIPAERISATNDPNRKSALHLLALDRSGDARCIMIRYSWSRSKKLKLLEPACGIGIANMVEEIRVGWGIIAWNDLDFDDSPETQETRKVANEILGGGNWYPS